MAKLQAQVDAFDHIYNTERPHQGLPGRVTPLAAWEAIEKAEAPRPKPEKPFYVQEAAKRVQPAPPPADLPAVTNLTKLSTAGTFSLANVTYLVGGQHGLQQVLVVVDGHTITVTDFDGVILQAHPGRTRGHLRRQRQTPRPTTLQSSPKS